MIIILMSSIFIIPGVWIISSGMRGILLGWQARNWPGVDGRIVSIQSEDTSDAEGNSRKLRLRYSYHVGSSGFVGTTIHPAYNLSSFERANRSVERAIRTGDPVHVHYDETKPDCSTLSVGFYSCSLMAITGGLISSVMGIVFLLVFGLGFEPDPLFVFGPLVALFLLIGWFFAFADGDFARGIVVVDPVKSQRD